MDLIKFDSPIGVSEIIQRTSVLTDFYTNSPGCNPFDDLSKECKFFANNEEFPNNETSFKNALDYNFDIEMPSVSVSDNTRFTFNLNNSYGSGKESLGILNLTGRESLDTSFSTRRDSIFGGRESLGILNLNSPNFRLSLISGAEDANILLQTIKEEPPAIILTKTDNTINESSLSSLNTGFLQPPSTCKSNSSTNNVSPLVISDTPCGNCTNNLKSCSVSTCYSFFENGLCTSNSKLNEGFRGSSNLHCSSSVNIKNQSEIALADELNEFRLRMKSMPLLDLKLLKENVEITDDSHVSMKNVVKKQFFSADRVKKSVPMKRRSFHEVLNFDEDSKEEDLNDSVFELEAIFFASQIADGSIFEENVKEDSCLLDDTSPPEWPESSDSDESKEAHNNNLKTSDKESAFKAIDKLLPAVTDPSNDLKFSLKLKKRSSNSTTNSSCSSKSIPNLSRISQESDHRENLSDRAKNLSDILHLETSKLNSSINHNKSAKELLQNLSAIFDNSNPTEIQKSEGQNLLCSLANILSDNNSVDSYNNKANSLEDSGHSSIDDAENEEAKKLSGEEEKHECFEVLDLRKSTSEVSNKQQQHQSEETPSSSSALDLSVKNKSFNNVVHVKPLVKTFGKKPSVILPNLSLKKNASNGSINSNDSAGSNLSVSSWNGSKFKAKSAVTGAKRGPMKAVVPLGEMAKQRRSLDLKKTVTPAGSLERLTVRNVTPTKIEQKSCNPKRTSTPLPESKLKPMAQSTPDSSDQQRRKTVGTPGRNTPVKSVATKVTPDTSDHRKKTFGTPRKITPVKSDVVTKVTPDTSDQHKKTFGTPRKITPVKSDVVTKITTPRTSGGSFLNNNNTSLNSVKNQSGSAPDLLGRKENVSGRRRSFTDLKSENVGVRMRSYSTGKDTGKGLMSALQKARESMSKSPYFKSTFGKLEKSSATKTTK